MVYKNEMFVTELADGYSDEILNEVKDVYAKAKKWDNYMSQIEEYAQGLRDIDDMIRKKNK